MPDGTVVGSRSLRPGANDQPSVRPALTMGWPRSQAWAIPRAAPWALAICACAALHGQDTVGTGSVRGVVVLADSSPATYARVCVAGTERCATSGQDGEFSALDARPGDLRLRVTLRSGETVMSDPVEVRAGLTSDVVLQLPESEAALTSITVGTAEFVAPEQVVSSALQVQNHVIAKSAGALQDISRYVSSLPGVVTGSADFRNDIIVRGGSPLENLFIVDNIEIPNINSFANLASAGGTVSLLDVQLIEDVTFLTGGYPAPYVSRLSSVMQVTQREGSRDGPRALATVAYAGAGAVLEGPWAGGRGSWLVSARRSFLDLFTDDIGTGGVPVYYSFTGKAVRDFGARDRVWVTSITGIDDIRLGIAEDFDPSDVLSSFDIRYNGRRNATGVNWQRIFGSKGVGLLGVSQSSAAVDSTVKDLARHGVFGPGADVDQILSAGATTFRQDSAESETTVKYDLTLRAGGSGELQAGGFHKHFRNDYTTLSPLGYDGPFTLVPDINPINLRERFGATQQGIYLQGTHRLAGRARLTLGGRVDRYGQFGQAHTRISPRAGVSVDLAGGLAWNSSWGVYHQLPLFLFLAAFPENRLLAPARADHWITGLSWMPGRGVRVTVEAYEKRYADYAASTQFPAVSLANVGDTFDVRDILYPMANGGRGRARGIELFAEKRYEGNWFGQVNLAYSRSLHAGIDGVMRPGAFDRPFVFNLIGGKRIGRKWDLALRAAYLTGRPYTPFREDLSQQQRRGIFDLARVNALRYSPFFTLDARVDRVFRVRDKRLVLYVGIQNVTGRRNATGVLWNRLTNRPSVGDGIGTFPLVGLEWEL